MDMKKIYKSGNRAYTQILFHIHRLLQSSVNGTLAHKHAHQLNRSMHTQREAQLHVDKSILRVSCCAAVMAVARKMSPKENNQNRLISEASQLTRRSKWVHINHQRW